jgi:hypothetical protein
MTTRNIVISIVVIAVIGLAALFLLRTDSELKPVETNMVRVFTPLSGATISSPLVVRGEARGNWFFEASFPVRLIDADGRELAVAPAQAGGDWMTEEFVPFEVTLTFATSATETGTLILEKDNPSGLPENADEVRVPVRFAQSSSSNNNNTSNRTVTLFYYDEASDTDASGNIMCSAESLDSVTRTIPVTNTPIQDTINLLLKGELTAAEQARGLSTEFPLQGVTLVGANLVSGVLTLEFNDPQNRTSGGSCRTGLIWAQIEATAKQFEEVNSVVFLPEELFQP